MTRVLTGAVLIAVLAAVLLGPTAAFVALVVAIVVVGWTEFVALAAAGGAPALRWTGGLVAIACALAHAIASPLAAALALGGGALLVAIVGTLSSRVDPRRAVSSVAVTTGGVAWLGALLGMQIGLRVLPHGVSRLALVYAVVATGDTAAFYFGTAFGRHRLAAGLSPKKSVEGAVAGLVTSGAVGALCSMLLEGLPDPAIGAVLGVALGACGQVGDLFESAFKRWAGRKDSSSLLPGHGGVLDRIDSHVFAGAALYLLSVTGLV